MHATVNYATEQASVSYDPQVVAPTDLIATVQSIGYDASLLRLSALRLQLNPRTPRPRCGSDF